MNIASCERSFDIFHSFRSVKGLVGFNVLEDLLLDNNQLKDDIEFPSMPSLKTLTINKNKVSFSYCFVFIV